MHERIKLVSDTVVEVRRNTLTTTLATTIKAGEKEIYYYANGTDAWDAEGRAALCDVLNCYDATGSFAALADTSKELFPGKVVRLKNCSGEWTFRYSHKSNMPGCRYHLTKGDERALASDDDILPLIDPPAPKYRPYTPAEATAFFGREFKNTLNSTYPLKYQTTNQLHSLNGNVVFHCLSKVGIDYSTWQKEYVWRDTNEPCGMREDEG